VNVDDLIRDRMVTVRYLEQARKVIGPSFDTITAESLGELIGCPRETAGKVRAGTAMVTFKMLLHGFIQWSAFDLGYIITGNYTSISKREKEMEKAFAIIHQTFDRCKKVCPFELLESTIKPFL